MLVTMYKMRIAFMSAFFFNSMGSYGANEALSTTCENRCWDIYNASLPCHCNYICRSYDNCCDDYLDLCLDPDKRKVSCYARCYESPDIKEEGACACDNECSANRNCCPDYTPECASEIQCNYRCGTPRNESLQCQCDNRCKENGDCCKDYKEACEIVPTATVTMTTSGASSITTVTSRGVLTALWTLALRNI